ncbi:MAG: PAS domain S-box protein [Nitrospirae bacterium]|nr:PAS domain S-box protein [Nitrospirota bacterium]
MLKAEITDIGSHWDNIINSINDGILIIDRDYNIVFANRVASKLFAFDNELPRRRCYEFLHKLSVPCNENYKFKTCPHKEVTLSGKPVSSTLPFVLISGEKKIFSVSAAPVKDSNGEVIQIVKIFQDVTEKKRTEEVLKRSEKEYRSLVDNSLAGVYKTNIKGDVIYANNALAKMLEFDSPDEVMTRSVLTFYKDINEREKIIESLKVTGGVRTIEVALLTKTGKTRDVLMSAVLEGETMSGMMMDITECKKMEALSRNQELLFSSIFEGMQDGMVVVDRNFSILYANSSYSRQTGFPLDEIMGKRCYEVSHHRKRPCYMEGEECSVKNAFATGAGNKIIHTHFDKEDNPVYVETAAYPIRDLSGNITSVAERVSNITEKLRLDEELKKRMKELEEFYEMAVGREIKMIELKAEVQNLKAELQRYKPAGRT